MSPSIEQTGWAKRLADMTKRGYATKKDFMLVGQWPTCAIGERMIALTGKRAANEDPRTVVADKLGTAFFDWVDKAREITAWGVTTTSTTRALAIQEATRIFKNIQKLHKITLLRR